MIKDNTTKKGIFDVIYSPDSDMSLLVQLHAGLEQNVVVMRHTHEWIEYVTRGAAEEPHQFEMYNATGIRADLRQTFGDIKEFVLCSCFAGNDFLPGLPLSMGSGTEVFDAVIDAYTKAFRNNLGRINLLDTSASGIHWANLSIYLDFLFLSEAGVLIKLFEKQTTQEDLYLLKDQETQEVIGDRRWSVLLESRASITSILPPSMREPGGQKTFQTFDYFVFCRLYQNYVCGTWNEVEEYRGVLEFNQTPNMCHNYLAGFVWILSYYTERTKNLNVNWIYGYNYAPTAYDLKKELEKFKRTPFWITEPMTKTGEIVTPLEHLVTILPPSKLNLIPKIAQSYFSEKLPDHFVDSFQVDMTSIPYNADKARELETAKVLINFPSRKRIDAIYRQIQNDDMVQAINKVNIVMKVGKAKKRK
jgi:5'-3' exonuclease